MPERIAFHLTEAVKGSDIAIDIHSSNIFLKEVPQIRISEDNAESLVPLAEKLNMDFIWVHQSVTVLQSTFSHTLNSLATKTLVVEMGVGMRLTEKYSKQLFDGIIHLLIEMGFLEMSFRRSIKKPIISNHGEVLFFNANFPGIFVPDMAHDEFVKEGERIGKIVSPLDGTVKEEILSPSDGFLFTLRVFPMVYEGSLLARVYREII